MSSLHRSQIYLEEDQVQQLKMEADREDIAVSEVVRRAINSYLKAKKEKTNWGHDPLTKAIGKIRLPVNDASVEHDHYLYGKKKRG